MPKILRVINRFNLGGPTYNAAYLTRYLPNSYETLLVGGQRTNAEEDSFHITNQLGIQPITIPEMTRDINPRNDRLAYQKIAQLIDWFQPDIVHTHASKAGALGRLAASNKKVNKIVHTFHGNVFHSYFNQAKTSAYISIERSLAKRTNRIVAISPLQKKELVEVYRIAEEDKVKVIPLGFDLDRFEIDQEEKRALFRMTYNLDEDEIAIGIIGRLVEIKNHRLFIEIAAQLIKKTGKKLRFFIIGDGDLKHDLMAYADQKGIKASNAPNKESSMIFTSWIKNIDVAVAGLDIIVMTSKNEGTPVSLIEAQAGKRAIVTTDVGGIRDIVIPDITALISSIHYPMSMIDHLLHLIDHPKLRHEMGLQGAKFIKDKFTYQRLVNDVNELYQSLLYE